MAVGFSIILSLFIATIDQGVSPKARSAAVFGPWTCFGRSKNTREYRDFRPSLTADEDCAVRRAHCDRALACSGENRRRPSLSLFLSTHTDPSPLPPLHAQQALSNQPANMSGKGSPAAGAKGSPAAAAKGATPTKSPEKAAAAITPAKEEQKQTEQPGMEFKMDMVGWGAGRGGLVGGGWGGLGS